MAVIEVKCPKCGSTYVIKHGRTAIGKQRYLCKDCRDSFLLEYTYNAYKPGTEETIIKMTANTSGMRDISRVLEISTDTVIKTLKKQKVHRLAVLLLKDLKVWKGKNQLPEE